MDKLLEWYDDNRELITVLEAETECGIPSGTLSKAIKGTRNLPKKYIEPLTVLMDSLTAAPSKNVAKVEPLDKTAKDKPVQIPEEVAPMLQPSKVAPEQETPKGITRTEKTASGIVVRFRDRYPKHEDKHSGDFQPVKQYKDKDGSTVRISSNGKVFKRTGNYKPVRFAFSQSDLT